MKFSTTPYKLNLRRARHLQIVLFGAFVFCYVGVLQYERIVHLLSVHLQLSPNSYPTPCSIALPSAMIAACAAYAFGRKVHLPSTMGGEFRLALFVALSIVFCIITSPGEVDTLTLKTARLIEQGRYDEALAASAKYANPTPQILNNRAKCLQRKNLLCEDFFTYPYGNANFSNSDFNIIVNDLGGEDERYTRSFNYLLRRDLDGLAQYLHDCNKGKLMRAEEEALILYSHLRTEPVLLCTNSTLEANYNDFCTLHDRLSAPGSGYTDVEISNLMREDYGSTYWCYYLQDDSASSFHFLCNDEPAQQLTTQQ